MRTPEIELLWWEGCPSTDRALAELRDALHELGLDAAEVKMREVRTDDDARDVSFRGSPTILVDGADVAAAGGSDGADEVGLSCRVYRRRDGRILATPDPEDLRDALRRAIAKPEQTR